MTCTAGNTINVAAGHSVVGCGFINDFVSCQGSLIGIPVMRFQKPEVRSLLSRDSCSPELESSIWVTAALWRITILSGMSGGSLTASSQVVGYGGSGSFTQTGGVSEPGELFLGSNLGKGIASVAPGS